MGLLYWPLEASIYAFMFHESSFVEELLYPSARQVQMRLFIMISFMGFGLFAQFTAQRQQRLLRQIERQKTEMRMLIDRALAAFVSIDEAGNIRDWNAQAEAVFGWTRKEALGRPLAETIIPEQQRQAHLQGLARFRVTGMGPLVGKTVETTALTKAGIEIPVELEVVALPDAHRHDFSAFIRDISERKQAEENLVLAQRVMHTTNAGIVVTDAHSNIIMVNPAFTAYTGYDQDEVIGKTPQILSSGRHDRAFYEQMWRTINTEGQWQGEIWNRRKNGELYLEWLHISAIKNAAGEVVNYMAVFTDITERKRTEGRMRFLSYHDQLTGLPNRTLFADRMQQGLASAKRKGHELALLFIDLDGFKQVNDSLGHDIGDALLMAVAARLRGCVRNMDTVARMGGDEFVIVLPEVGGPEDASKVAGKVLAMIDLPIDIAGKEVSVGASIGISLFPQDGKETDTLLRQADAAMYQAKFVGKDRYCLFHDIPRAEQKERQAKRA